MPVCETRWFWGHEGESVGKRRPCRQGGCTWVVQRFGGVTAFLQRLGGEHFSRVYEELHGAGWASNLALPTMFCEVTTTTMKERAGRCICTMKTLPALETTLHCCGPGRMRTLPRTKSSKGDVGGAAYWNTNSELAMYIVLADNRYRALLSSRK
jgi:hypothetical protein